MDTPRTLIEAVTYYSNLDRCHAYMVSRRWPDGVVTCPTCGNTHVRFDRKRRVFECNARHPRRQFSVKVGTIFEDSPLGLDKWLPCVWLIANAKNGISSYEIARALGVTQKTAWFMLHRIRLALQSKDGGELGGEVEADETYIGGKARNMHASKKTRLNVRDGRSLAGKVAVMGLLERHSKGSSQVRTVVLNSLRRSHVQGHVRAHVEPGASLNTDAFSSYAGLESDYAHKVIDHAEAYVDGTVHTNGLENYWSLLKRMIKGTYVAIEPFHLFRYLDEETFRFNARETDDAGRFRVAVAGILGRRLTYKTLIGAMADGTASL